MVVYMVGGTGLLGSEGAAELIRRGHRVRTIALPPLPAGAALPEGMEIELGNFMELDDAALRGRLSGCDALVFAAGVDERVPGPPPIYDFFAKYNIAPLRRLLGLAKEAGVRKAVVCGSYFSYFDRAWPQLRLAERNPYIRSRVDQSGMALSFAEEGFDVAVLELPYIFGAQPGRRPVWLFLVELILSMRGATFYPPGGSAMVTVRQVGQCIAGAVERARGGARFPIGWYNLSWREMLALFHRSMGLAGRPVVTLPRWIFTLAMLFRKASERRAGREGGLDPVAFAPVMCGRAFIDKSLGAEPLGAGPDDLEAAIAGSVGLCMELMRGGVEAVDMRGE